MNRRVLLRLAFDGSLFRGTQRQPHRETVNDALLGVLRAADMLASEPMLRAQGRKDSGASALDYPIAFDATRDPSTIARTLAGQTVGIIPWAAGDVEPGYDPRLEARARTYRYHLPVPAQGVDLPAVREAWRLFEGTHDFRSLARMTERRRAREPVRTIHAARCWTEDEVLILECTGESFLWNQVRRMVGAALAVGQGRVSIADLQAALTGQRLASHDTAPAQGLVLQRVDLGLEVPACPKAREVALGRLRERRERVQQHALVLDALFAGPSSQRG